MLNSPIEGDWIVRDGISLTQVLPRLEEVLRDQCKLPVRIRLAEVKREVVVVKGEYKFSPMPGEAILIYGKVYTERHGGGGTGNYEEFVRAIGSFINRRIVSDVADPPEGPLTWWFNARSPEIEGWNDRDPESVLTHLSEQTGLLFVNETRTVPVVFVDRAEQAANGRQGR